MQITSFFFINDGLFSEKFSLWMQSPKKTTLSYLEDKASFGNISKKKKESRQKSLNRKVDKCIVH